MGTLLNTFNIAVTYLVPVIVWSLLTVGAYQLVRELRHPLD
jgi:hypothetical protein